MLVVGREVCHSTIQIAQQDKIFTGKTRSKARPEYNFHPFRTLASFPKGMSW